MTQKKIPGNLKRIGDPDPPGAALGDPDPPPTALGDPDPPGIGTQAKVRTSSIQGGSSAGLRGQHVVLITKRLLFLVGTALLVTAGYLAATQLFPAMQSADLIRIQCPAGCPILDNIEATISWLIPATLCTAIPGAALFVATLVKGLRR